MKETNKRILIYLLFTFIVTYFVEIFLVAPILGSTDMEQAMTAQSLITGVMFVPAVGVIFTRLITKEGMTGRDLYFSINLKANLKYYGLMWFGFGALTLVGAALYFVMFPSVFDPDMGYAAAILEAQGQTELDGAAVRGVMIIQLLTGFLMAPFANILNCFGEEWGWRGYLLPKLLEKHRTVPAILINGVIWGLWHAPLIVMGHNYGTGYPGFPFVGILAMCLFCVVIGSILSYVTIKTHSCIPAILGHGMINGFSTIGIYATSLEKPYNVFLGPAPTGLIGGLGFLALAIFLLWKLNKEQSEQKQGEKL